MSIYLKNLIKVSNKIEYVVVSFYKDKTKPASYSQDSEMTLTKYITLLTNSNIRYTNVKQFKILKELKDLKGLFPFICSCFPIWQCSFGFH